MSRAFVTESDGMNFCREMERNCPEANLRGRCGLDKCRYIVEERPVAQKSGSGEDSDKQI